MSIKEAFNKVKTFVDVYKIWIFIAALFGTNGMQAYFNSDEEIKPEPEVNVAKIKTTSNNRSFNLKEVNKKLDKLLAEDCSGNVIDHEKEHHGGK